MMIATTRKTMRAKVPTPKSDGGIGAIGAMGEGEGGAQAHISP
eukprot:CAMPEP_0119419940 /NCGR_PEP_ID=MMETSP1335-20130426/22197_1 /TAXON_ID=259385 /ORGANISM="Chrysoculter rhomboideus, Strain RCC1486" /LENGTH=42 /DNA_ID= /DNA_START= /DNA_END= /DNA_ORIENTATION=